MIPDNWKSLVSDRASWRYIEKIWQGRQMSYFDLQYTGNYSKVPIYWYNELYFSLSICGPGWLYCITFLMRSVTLIIEMEWGV